MDETKLKSKDQKSSKQTLLVRATLRRFVKISIIAGFIICTLGTSSVQAQEIFTTTFAPGIYNPGDPSNANWNEPKNWSWYPGVEPGRYSPIKIVIVQNCFINSRELNIYGGANIEITDNFLGIFPKATFTVYSGFTNNGRISGGGELILKPDVVFGSQLIINDQTIECHTLTVDVDRLSNRGTISCHQINCREIKNASYGKITNHGIFKGNLLQENNGLFYNNGTLEGNVKISHGNFNNRGTVNGQITNSIFGYVYNWGNLNLDTGSSKLNFLNNYTTGRITIDASLEVSGNIENLGAIVNNNEFTIANSTIISSDYIKNSGSISNTGGNMTIGENAPFENSGTLINNGGNLTIASSYFDNSGGHIKGDGTFHSTGYWTNKGTLAPGNSPGEMNHSGNYREQGELHIEIAGRTAVSEYDVHSISGSYIAGGRLRVQFINGFRPVAGDVFKIVNAGSRNGNFSSLSLPFLYEGTIWDVEYNAADITLTVSNRVVPVTWLDFTVSADERTGNNVDLSWSTAEEINNLGFEVERSDDGRTWEQIGFQEAQRKNAEQYHYEYIDLNPENGLNYYRLKQLDYNGDFEYSDVRSIELRNEGNSNMAIYPNPAPGNLITISFDQVEEKSATLSIIDLSGKVVYQQNVEVQKGNNLHSVDTPNLSAGTYIISMKSDKTQTQQKWVKL